MQFFSVPAGKLGLAISTLTLLFTPCFFTPCFVVAQTATAVASGSNTTGNLIAQPLIVQPVDESRLTVLKGNTHPFTRRQTDLGTAPASLPMERMLLVLKRSPEQGLALRAMIDSQQDKNSPNYHKWLTPEQFGKQFGPSDSDLQIVTAWLQSHGFRVEAPSNG